MLSHLDEQNMKNALQNLNSIALCIICLMVTVSLSGCANLLSQFDKAEAQPSPPNLGNAELYTFQLAQELFNNLASNGQYRYAVAGFVPITTMQTDLKQQGPLMLLGHQLEQGLMTEAVRRGYVTQDFKAANAIIMSEQYDRVLSRDLDHLSASQNIDYYITGTITPQQNGAMVNARIIDVRSKDVVAAATSFFPADLFWQQEQVTIRNGHLYRTDKNPSINRGSSAMLQE